MTVCPTTGRACLSRPCINRLRSGCFLDDERPHSLAEIADECGVDERSIRRDEERVLAKIRAGLEFIDGISDVRAAEVIRRVIEIGLRNYSSTENATFSRPPRRFSAPPSDRVLAARTATSSSSASSEQSARPPRRFSLPPRSP